VGDVLQWVADEGWEDFWARHGGSDYRSAAEFRARHLADAVAALLKGRE